MIYSIWSTLFSDEEAKSDATIYVKKRQVHDNTMDSVV